MENQKILDTCLGVFQNLDQGPGEALKTVFLKYGYYFGMDGPRGLKFFLNNRESKNIGHVSRIFPKFGPGTGWGLENCFFFNMAIILERIDLEA